MTAASGKEPLISGETAERFSAVGQSLIVHEWRGSGPAALHVHHADDEAWHVLEGTLRFRFADRVADLGPGRQVFLPAGVAHTYRAGEPRSLVTEPPQARSAL